MKILIIDNYDSFTYNLVQLVGRFTTNIDVYRNDKITIKHIRIINPEKIILSPGPGRPENSNICLKIIHELKGVIPILGICLGHQAIGIAFGGKIINAPILIHGKSSSINHTGDGLFNNIPQGFQAGRYHSLILSSQNFSERFKVTATCSKDIIMGIRHKSLPLEGIQFHPESVLTPIGYKLIGNWLYEKKS